MYLLLNYLYIKKWMNNLLELVSFILLNNDRRKTYQLFLQIHIKLIVNDKTKWRGNRRNVWIVF